MIVSPGQFTQRSAFYHQLHQLTGAGLGLIATLNQLHRSPPARSYREPIQHVLEQLAHGATFADALRSVHGWLPAFDMTLIEAGERSGRLDASFRLLANYYADRARVTRQVIADLMYPAFLMHFAVFILPFPSLFMTGNWQGYLLQIFSVLAPVYGVIALLIFAMQGKHGEVWRGWMEALLHPVPILGTARRDIALGRLSAALEALLSAGIGIVEAWEMAAAASGSPALRRTVAGWRSRVQAGETPAEVIREAPEFPSLFADQYATGEVSGSLEVTLERMHEYYQEEGTRKLHAVAQWSPRLIYLGIVFIIAWKIISFYMGYFQQIRDATAF